MFTVRKLKRGTILIWLLISALSLLLTAEKPGNLFPDVIPLPNGFQPEGLAVGRGTTFYVGSIPTGAIYRGDLATGQGAVLVPGQAGRQSLGLKFDGRTNLLYVAGGATGAAFIYDAKTGANVATIQLTSDPATFINDVIITEEAAYFTDSYRAFFYRVPLKHDGKLPNPPVSKAIPLSGDFVLVPSAFNSNGIVARPDGEQLIIISSVQAALYRVDSQTGIARKIDLGGGSVPNGDGLLLKGKTLYVVENFSNLVAVIRLDSKLGSGKIVQTITSQLLRIPTTIARFGNQLYVVNARFDTTPTPQTPYEVVRLPGR